MSAMQSARIPQEPSSTPRTQVDVLDLFFGPIGIPAVRAAAAQMARAKAR